MKIHDISVPIRSEMPVYAGDRPVSIEPKVRISKGGLFNISRIAMSTHTGTHVDPPYHFIEDAATIEELPLDTLIGEAWLADMGESGLITADILEGAAIPADTERLLLKTKNSLLWNDDDFRRDFVALDTSAAAWCRDRGLRLLGIDYMSVAPFEAPIETHHILLGAGIVVVEGIDLSRVTPGRYTLICLPLLIHGGDGAPARAVLIEE